MHEGTLIRDLVHRVVKIAEAENATRVTAVSIRVGDFSHASPEHLREHFVHEAHGTLAAGARLDIVSVGGLEDETSLEIILDEVEVDVDDETSDSVPA